MFLDNVLENFVLNAENVFYNNEKKITYGDLYKYVYNLYSYLNSIKNEENNTVIVYGHKDVTMLISFLACSFAGITYVPIDICTNKNRIEEIVNIINPLAIIATEEIEVSNINVISKDDIENTIYKEIDTKDIELVPLMKPEDIYYIIFTSGSTGIPKGVQVTYNNMDTYVTSLKETIKIKNSKVLNQALYSFDLSVADIYLSLITACEHIPLKKSIIQEYSNLYNYIKEKDFEVLVCTSSFIDYLLIDKNFNEENIKNFKYIYMCGEVLTNKTVCKIYERFKNIEIINAYGPTECTVAVTSTQINRDTLKEENLPIGKKEDNTFVIVDDEINELSDGSVGNILIVGDLVSNGYINYSTENFIQYKGKKAYLTGDIGYIQSNLLYYKCRKDRQVKFRGYRIELSDIEENINKIDGVSKSAVVTKRDTNNKVIKLVAYVVLNKEVNNIEEHLKKNLPSYMIPTIKVVNELPVNNNFKIDIKRIEELENER